MRRLRRNFLITTVALVAAVVLYIVATLPPTTKHLAVAPPAGSMSGAFHIHSNRSDGGGSLADIAASAGEAQFVIVTDHGDATRRPEPPQYMNGVLVIDAVEISTTGGHLIALGLTGESPFPLGGEARDTQEDVRRLGGWTVIAHPDSPKEELRWREDSVPVDGLEWLNADSEWRDEGTGRLLLTVGHYLFRSPESIAAIFSRPAASLRRWDELSKRRNVVALAGVDAHARIGPEEGAATKPSRLHFSRPTYRDMFRTLNQVVILPTPLSGNAERDAGMVLDALRNGRTYSVVSAIATPAQVSFSATDGNRTVGMGESLETSLGVKVMASVGAPADATVVIIRDGEEVAAGQASAAFEATGQPAVYRAEVRLPGHAVPWIVTNMIRVGAVPREATQIPPVPSVVRRLDDLAAWAPEKHTTSRSDIRVSDGEVAMSYQLSSGPLGGQFAAMSYPLEGPVPFESITATLRASAPMRVSVQVRQPGGRDGERWHRSVYVDQTPRTVTLDLQDFRLGEEVTDRKPSPAAVRSVMFVVDTWHTKPGSSGTIWVSSVSLGGATPPATSGR